MKKWSHTNTFLLHFQYNEKGKGIDHPFGSAFTQPINNESYMKGVFSLSLSNGDQTGTQAYPFTSK
ncbi:hypothetical protein [Peribacillus simplex]|uniref:hypothetical protein n=1 Tax=Peribacillus simplex TaxID=1478 RepID=UPI001C8784BA|nr:hypothetical protein [Peribacillus simplex]